MAAYPLTCAKHPNPLVLFPAALFCKVASFSFVKGLSAKCCLRISWRFGKDKIDMPWLLSTYGSHGAWRCPVDLLNSLVHMFILWNGLQYLSIFA